MLVGGGTTTRHVLTTTDILLNYYLNLLYRYDIEKVLSLGFESYKNHKARSAEYLSSQIPLDLYRSYLDNNDTILETEPELLYDKLLSLYKNNGFKSSRENNGVNNISPQIAKKVKIIVDNLLISRRSIIKTMSLHQKTNLITKVERSLAYKSDNLAKLEYKYDLGFPLISSRKERILARKAMKKEILTVSAARLETNILMKKLILKRILVN